MKAWTNCERFPFISLAADAVQANEILCEREETGLWSNDVLGYQWDDLYLFRYLLTEDFGPEDERFFARMLEYLSEKHMIRVDDWGYEL